MKSASQIYSSDHDCRASHVHCTSKYRNIPCLVKRPVSPNLRRITAFSPSQATLTVDCTVSMEMSQKESILWTGSAFSGYWTGKLRELRPAPACRPRRGVYQA